MIVVLAGPQAAGKSTIARALHDELAMDGERVALVELDRIAEMTAPGPPDWVAARGVLAAVVSEWARTGATVIAEGVGWVGEVDEVRRRLPAESTVLTVAVTTSIEEAFARAQRDPTRGISRSRAFLEDVYESWSRELDPARFDVVVDTSDGDVRRAAAQVRRAMPRSGGF